MNQETINKIKGIIYGQVIGDALGLGTEFMSKEKVDRIYPKGLTDYSQIKSNIWIQGEWSDDTDMFLCILDSLIENKEVDLLDIANRFYNWSRSNPKDIGITTRQVLNWSDYRKDPHKASKELWEASGRNGAANGALMRNAIVGIWDYWNEDRVRKNTIDICKLTHYDPRCVDSCIIHSRIISAGLTGNACDSDCLSDLIDNLDPRIKSWLNENLTPEISSLKLEEQHTMGYTLKALGAALWAYNYAESFEQGLLAIVNEGGDADTNGCIAASVLGAKFGFDAIPKRWVEGIYRAEDIEERGEHFLTVLGQCSDV